MYVCMYVGVRTYVAGQAVLCTQPKYIPTYSVCTYLAKKCALVHVTHIRCQNYLRPRSQALCTIYVCTFVFDQSKRTQQQQKVVV